MNSCRRTLKADHMLVNSWLFFLAGMEKKNSYGPLMCATDVVISGRGFLSFR